MPYDRDQLANLEADLASLDSPTSEDVFALSDDYDAGIVAAVAAKMALGGGAVDPSALGRASYWGDTITVDPGSPGVIPWTDKNSGSDLLNLTSHTNPTIVTAGVYAVTAMVNSETGIVAGKTFDLQLDLDRDGEAPQFTQTTGGDGSNRSYATVSGIYYIPAGGVIRVTVTNNNNSDSEDFTLYNGIVQRLV